MRSIHCNEFKPENTYWRVSLHHIHTVVYKTYKVLQGPSSDNLLNRKAMICAHSVKKPQYSWKLTKNYKKDFNSHQSSLNFSDQFH